MDLTGKLELLWFFGLAFFALIVFLGNRPGRKRGISVKFGALFLVLGYLGLMKEYMLSYVEIETFKWFVRLGITLLLFDLAKRTTIQNPKQEFKEFVEQLKGFFRSLKRKP